MTDDILKLLPKEITVAMKGTENRVNKGMEKGSISFYQPHVIMAHLLGHDDLINPKKLKYSDSYYFTINLNSDVPKKCKLRISNHKANLSTVSQTGIVNESDGTIYQVSIVLDCRNFNMPENGLIKKLILFETIFNDCDLNTFNNILLECRKIMKDGYNKNSSICGQEPIVRTNEDAKRQDLDKKLNDIKTQLKTTSSKTVIPFDTVQKKDDGIIGQISQYTPKPITKTLSKKEKEKLQKKQEEERKSQEEIEKNTNHIVECQIDNDGNLISFYLDNKKIDIKDDEYFFILKKFYNNDEKSIPFYVLTSKMHFFKLGTFHYFINGEPYYTLQIKDKKYGNGVVTKDDNMFEYITEKVKEKRIMNENLNYEHGTPGMGTKELSPANRRKLQQMYTKIQSISNSFLSTENDYEKWSFCKMDNFPPFYFAVNYIKPIRPSDKNNPLETFTMIKIRITRHFADMTMPENMRNEVSEFSISLSPKGMKNFDIFMKGMEEAKTYQANGFNNAQNPRFINAVFKLNDNTLQNIARKERFDENKLAKLIFEVLRKEIKKIL